MLILSRRRGESIIIGDDIEVFVVDLKDGKVRLGVAGPAWMPVHQRERYDRQQQRHASRLGAGAQSAIVGPRQNALTVGLSHNI
jgi:carbon storage regulator CsrA